MPSIPLHAPGRCLIDNQVVQPNTLPIVFSDLDGTLLDHHSYSFHAAQPALDLLRANRFPLVLNTSKTVPEVMSIRRKLGNNDPFVVENGSALLIPSGYFEHLDETEFESYPGSEGALLVHYFGHPYQETCDLLYSLRQELSLAFKGFAEMSNTEVATITELPLKDATMARQRMSAEPVLWLDDDSGKQKLADALKQHDRVLLQGGRFLHVMSRVDKSLGVNWLMPLFREKFQSRLRRSDARLISIALGDSPNDLGMLDSSEIAVVIPAEQNKSLELTGHPDALYPESTGPQGWQQAMELLFQRFEISGVNHG